MHTAPAVDDLAAQLADNRALQQVREFWNREPCGVRFVDLPLGSPEFYEQYRAIRYEKAWHLNHLVPFEQCAGRDVLEIGCGLGSEGTRFAAAGARYTGVDLTPAAVDATRRHFEILNLPGRFLVQNAEHMTDFADGSFDFVYSHGVLHHTPNLQQAMAEVHRVLRPGGKILIMLYHRRSFNYYVRILGMMRARLLAYTLLRPLLPAGKRRGVNEEHWQNLSRMGWRYLSREVFPHRCADGPDCPIAHSFTRADVRRIFAPYFTNLRFAVAHFPVRWVARAMPKGVEGVLARRIGWHLFVYGDRA